MATSHLKRTLSLPLVTLYGLGNILGAGIYVLVGKVAGYSGENTILAFMIAMIIAGLTAFSYMELSSRFPQSASVSVYLHKAFGIRQLSVVIGLALVLGGIASAAALSQGFAGYLNDIFSVPKLLASIGLLVLLGLIAVKGIGESAKFAAIFTLVETAGLLLIIWAGRQYIDASAFTQSFSVDPAIGISGILFGAFLAFYAFIGFEDMVNVVEEVKEPRRTMPLAILISLVSATILYLLVVIVSMAAVAPSELANSSAPLSLVFDRISHIDPLYISIIGIAAAVNGVLVQIIMGSRILYGLSKQGWVSTKFSGVHPKYGTPLYATIVVTLAMIVGTMVFGLVSLATVTSFLVLTVFTLVNASLVVIKRRDSSKGQFVKVPLIIPVLGTATCLSMIVYQIFF
jgi:APA family basic amino acid/polyamine antiporter